MTVMAEVGVELPPEPGLSQQAMWPALETVPVWQLGRHRLSKCGEEAAWDSLKEGLSKGPKLQEDTRAKL